MPRETKILEVPIEGPAGSEKTFQLTEALKLFLRDRALGENEAALGIT